MPVIRVLLVLVVLVAAGCGDDEVRGDSDEGPGGAAGASATWVLAGGVSEEPIRLMIVATPTANGRDELVAGRCLFVGGIKLRFDRGGERAVGSEGQPVLVLRPQNGKPCL